MKRVKRAIMTLAALATLTGVAAAQYGPGPGPGPGQGMGPGPGMGPAGMKKGAGQKMSNPDQRLARMGQRLGLTEEQKVKIKPLLDEEAKEMRAIRNDDNLTRAQLQQKMQQVRDTYHDKIKEHLTPDQQKKADEYREMARQRWEKKQQMKQQQMKQQQ